MYYRYFYFFFYFVLANLTSFDGLVLLMPLNVFKESYARGIQSWISRTVFNNIKYNVKVYYLVIFYISVFSCQKLKKGNTLYHLNFKNDVYVYRHFVCLSLSLLGYSLVFVFCVPVRVFLCLCFLCP